MEYEAAQGRPLREVLRICDEKTRSESKTRWKRFGGRQNVSAFPTAWFLPASRVRISHRLTGAPILNQNREIVGVAIVFRDVTQRRQTEQTLRASERLTLAGRLSATIAHEIRNPRYRYQPDLLAAARASSKLGIGALSADGQR